MSCISGDLSKEIEDERKNSRYRTTDLSEQAVE